ncbi:prepilin-type N-terminal cleavage/methylation domain-containing protein [Pleurocapsales cyanobacterium LEGE 10410]|nr:prepilin-type N-terminal cleavage/methylation domain-containing protein [Pleurocapsales cyanobacterium LEGE 10410]
MLLYNVLRKSDKGFTLIEIITTVIIVGVLASIAAPNFLGMLNQTRIKDGLGQVEGAIREAQRLAIRRGKPCRILFTTDGTGSSIVEIAPDSGSVSYSGCLLSTRELPDSVSFSLLTGGTLVPINSFNEAELTFSSKGNPDVEGIMVISHTGTNTSKCVQIEGLLGNILTGDYNSTTQECEA